MKCVVLTLFPEEMAAYFLKGLIGKAYRAGYFDISFKNLRDYSQDAYQKVDDYPFGGGQGLVLRGDVLVNAVKSIEHYGQYRLLCPCPTGVKFTDVHVKQWKGESKGIILLCGYYEGIDERVFHLLPVQKVSLGSFILTSGELPALVILDALVRTIPNVLGNPACIEDESFYGGLLEYPQFTHPDQIDGVGVPSVLLSGHHKNITLWKREQSLKKTLWGCPSLFDQQSLSADDRSCLTDILRGEKND